jgi:hypothetical protein
MNFLRVIVEFEWFGALIFILFVGLYEFSTSPIDAFVAPNLLRNIEEQVFFDNRNGRHHGFIQVTKLVKSWTVIPSQDLFWTNQNFLQVSTTSNPPFVKYTLYGTDDKAPLFNLTLTPEDMIVS